MAKNKNTKSSTNTSSNQSFVFGKQNYQIMLIGLVVIVIGFVLMWGKEDIYDFRKTVLAPIVVLAGFVIEFFAIMRKPKGE